MNKLLHEKYTYFETILSQWKYAYVAKAINKLTSRKVNLFLRTNDIISKRPLIEGTHEPHLKKLYEFLSDEGYSQYFFDIGANIGLSSCLVSEKFDRFFLFEPNPLIFKILEVNVALQKVHDNWSLLNFGLGSEDGSLKLMVPKDNWGGAFIVGNDNGYDKSLLASKDSFDVFDESNYNELTVNVKKAEKVLGKIFSELNQESMTKGIIKLDVEGFEQVVLEGISASLPSTFSTFIVFENWDKNFNLDKILNGFGKSAKAFKISINRPIKTQWSKIRKVLYLAFLLLTGNGNAEFYIEEIKYGDEIIGDLIIQYN